MNENAGQFRSAAFGGFHRQDVLDYLARITRENQDKTLELTKALEEAQSARTQAETALAEAKEQAAEAAAAREAMAEELARTQKVLEEADTARAAAEERAEELTDRVRQLGPDAASWQRIKDTAGDIEVGAHERAQITLQKARAQAAQIRAEGVRWVLEIQARCDRLKRDLREAVTSAESELDQVHAAFVQAQEEMEGIQSALSDLVSSAGEGDRDEHFF
ncbi:MAG: hypothetical protein MR286_04250 [Clostridiales bacterium]|nr:hypothetical protein [Clostridiales bacterium]